MYADVCKIVRGKMGEWNEHTKTICVTKIAITSILLKISIRAVLN